jgi:ubiquinone biosynthesis protein COQ4
MFYTPMRNPVPMLRLLVAIGGLVRRPENLDRVTQIVDLLEKLKSEEDSAAIVREVRADPQGRAALATRPSLGSLDPRELARLPEGTLGGAYGRFMTSRGLSQASFPELRVRTDMDWIISHFYETHDLWHVVAGFDTDVPGEVGLQAFYLAQTRSYLPFFVIAALMINTAVYAYDEKDRRLQALADGWNLGKRARPLFGQDWRALLDRPLAEVRSQLGIPAPAVT